MVGGHDWRWVSASVRGTSHVRAQLPCQDASDIRAIEGGRHGRVLVLVCADGAGSAPMSQEGSLLAVRSIVQSVANFMIDGKAAADIEEKTFTEWFRMAAWHLQEEADYAGRPVRDYACTLLCAVVDAQTAAYAQLGDGAIVAGCGEAIEPIFWPQQGEFANTTFFITAPEHLDRIQTRVAAEVPERMAMMSDGLQTLALRFADRTAHAGFFSPLFEGLLQHGEGWVEALATPLTEFLDSSRVNARTDDDKSLLLAVRQLTMHMTCSDPLEKPESAG